MMLGFAIYATRFFFAHLSQPQVAGFGDVVRQLWGDFTYLRLTPSSSSNQEQVDKIVLLMNQNVLLGGHSMTT